MTRSLVPSRYFHLFRVSFAILSHFFSPAKWIQFLRFCNIFENPHRPLPGTRLADAFVSYWSLWKNNLIIFVHT